MLDALTFDQLKVFAAACEEGSFSGAGRRLLRAQSVISQSVSNLEGILGVALFDRSARYPVLTPQGRALLEDAKAIISNIDGFKAKAKGMATGLEPELSMVVDVMFPMEALTLAVRDFTAAFPETPLRLYVEALGSVVQFVLEEKCALGVIGSLPDVPDKLRAEPVLKIGMAMVAAPTHPLAALKEPIQRSELARYTQLILTDRTDLSSSKDFGVMSPKQWLLADLAAKQAFLLGGLGWGGMPLDTVRDDIDAGRLVVLRIEGDAPEGVFMRLSVVYPSAAPPGPAGRWMVNRLKQC